MSGKNQKTGSVVSCCFETCMLTQNFEILSASAEMNNPSKKIKPKLNRPKIENDVVSDFDNPKYQMAPNRKNSKTTHPIKFDFFF